MALVVCVNVLFVSVEHVQISCFLAIFLFPLVNMRHYCQISFHRFLPILKFHYSRNTLFTVQSSSQFYQILLLNISSTTELFICVRSCTIKLTYLVASSSPRDELYLSNKPMFIQVCKKRSLHKPTLTRGTRFSQVDIDYACRKVCF